MQPRQSALDHHIVHQDQHGSRVRIVANADVDESLAAAEALLPARIRALDADRLPSRVRLHGRRAGVARGRADLGASQPDCRARATPSRRRYTRPACERRLTNHFRISSAQNGTDASTRLTTTSSPVSGRCLQQALPERHVRHHHLQQERDGDDHEQRHVGERPDGEEGIALGSDRQDQRELRQRQRREHHRPPALVADLVVVVAHGERRQAEHEPAPDHLLQQPASRGCSPSAGPAAAASRAARAAPRSAPGPGRPSVTRLIQRICSGSSGSGMPEERRDEHQPTARPSCCCSRYLMNLRMLS